MDNRSARYQMQNGRQQSYNTNQQNNKPQPSVEQEDVQAGSTMEYLEEKARQDAMEHAREKREEEMRLRKSYGGLRVAERHYDGDSIPRGKRCIVCAYCGAENLIPENARERHSCYFCREAL